MAELRFTSPPPREELIDALRGPLAAAAPGVRWVAEGILGADATIDFVGVEAGGRAVIAVVAGAEDDLSLVSRGLAQQAWVEPRVADWAQLAGDLGWSPGASVRVLLVAAAFGAEARAAAAALGDAAPELIVYRCIQNGAGVSVLLDAQPTPGAPQPAGASAAPAPPEAGEFRTGLVDADLGLSAEERREFE